MAILQQHNFKIVSIAQTIISFHEFQKQKKAFISESFGKVEKVEEIPGQNEYIQKSRISNIINVRNNYTNDSFRPTASNIILFQIVLSSSITIQTVTSKLNF